MTPLNIANAAGFLGDNLDAARRLVSTVRVDYLTLEYLAELTMSILARLREKDPQQGYATDFLGVLAGLLDELRRQPNLRIVTNAGGTNPHACAAMAGRILAAGGLGESRVGVVSGDDLLGRLDELCEAGCRFENLDTGKPLSELPQPVVSANAYLGGKPIAVALEQEARFVITGRVADASLAVGPAVHEMGWRWDDFDRLAGASVAGHLIECGAQVTGGYHARWADNLADVGYPIAELADDGNCVITKPAASGGIVDRQTVAEQLVYEIGDPAHYLTPDVDVDFTGIELAERGADRVAVWGAKGGPPTDEFKVSLAYRAGYMASGQLLVYGPDCVEKARACAEIVLARIHAAGFDMEQAYVECLGAGEGVPGLGSPPAGLREVVLRLTACDPRREAVERFAAEFAPLATSGPAGLAGYASGRPQVRPRFAYWPTLVPRHVVEPQVEVRTAFQWAAD